MTSLLEKLSTLGDLALVMLGFGLIIFIHELGHFLAARWAGIRVLTFAIGFGPSVCSFRRNLGWRRGSSELEYLRLPPAARLASSPTEYRVNLLPLGGYVRMLGQEDLDPTAVSDAPDSYQNCPPWKRMIVISAGVIMNLITAALIFVAVFMIGLRVEPPVIGDVLPGSAAGKAVLVGQEGGEGPGLKPGDEIVEINGRKPNSFNDLALATAMTKPGETLELAVRRDGSPAPLRFQISPQVGRASGLFELGVEGLRSLRILSSERASVNDQIRPALEAMGLAGVEPGSRVVRVAGRDVASMAEFLGAVRGAQGQSVEVAFDNGAVVTLSPRPQLQTDLVEHESGRAMTIEHVLGLSPVLCVALQSEEPPKQGLKPGDIFARIGAVEFPSIAQGIAQIRSHARQNLDIVVLRRQSDGTLGEVPLTVQVSKGGQVGFAASSTAATDNWLSLPPRVLASGGLLSSDPPPAAAVITRPGLRLAAIDQIPVANLYQARDTLRDATAAALARGEAASVQLTLLPPDPTEPPVRVTMPISLQNLRALHALGWQSPIPAGLFAPEQVTLKAQTPAEAIGLGLSETKRVMITTYLTFARLFQGSVKVEHLKGPVGIAHLGTIIADRGLIWLLFFFGLISVNLAVINFLPLPIVDGGQFIFLVIEQLRGRPVPVQVQNAATIAGLILIGSVFLVVTVNDVANLFGF